MSNILFLDAYFNPEITADTHLENDLIEALIKDGHTIFVSCPTPTRGVSKATIKEYKSKKKEIKNNGRLVINRFWAPRECKNPVLRAFRYIYCTFVQFKKCTRLKNIDIIYCVSTPPTQGMLSAFIKEKLCKKTKREIANIYYLEDIFPDTLVASGLSKNGSLIWKIGRIIENYTYKHASKIITVSDACMKNIVDKGAEENKVSIITNWIDLSSVKYISRSENTLFDKYHLDRKKFYVVYAGNLGFAQNVDLILNAAKCFLSKDNNIVFVLFGSGGEETRIKSRINMEKIENTLILPLQPSEKVKEVYSLGDVDIVTCKKGFGLSAMPSKTWSIMSTERPVIASFDKESDLCQLISETNSGICSEADDAEELVNAIIRVFRMNEDERVQMGKNGRTYVMKYRDKTACLLAFRSVFNELLQEGK